MSDESFFALPTNERKPQELWDQSELLDRLSSQRKALFSPNPWLCLVSCPCFIIAKVWWKTLQHQRENKYFSFERFSNVYQPVWINQKLLINVKILDIYLITMNVCRRFNKYFDIPWQWRHWPHRARVWGPSKRNSMNRPSLFCVAKVVIMYGMAVLKSP